MESVGCGRRSQKITEKITEITELAWGSTPPDLRSGGGPGNRAIGNSCFTWSGAWVKRRRRAGEGTPVFLLSQIEWVKPAKFRTFIFPAERRRWGDFHGLGVLTDLGLVIGKG